jgi:hypothetical protein
LNNIKSTRVKILFTLLLFIALSAALHAQRILPVLLDTPDSVYQADYTQGAAYDLKVYNNKLLAAGRFSKFMMLEAQNLAYWNGTSSEPFSPMPLFNSNSDHILQLLVVNDTLIISGKLPIYNGAARLVNGVWENFGMAGETSLLKIEIHNGEYYTALDSLLYQRIGEEWIEITPEILTAGIQDIISFQNELYLCTSHSVYRKDGENWFQYPQILYGKIRVFSVVEGELLAGGSFTSDNFNSAYSKVLKVEDSTLSPKSLINPDENFTIGEIFKVFDEYYFTPPYAGIGLMGAGTSISTSDPSGREISYPIIDIEIFQGVLYASIESSNFLISNGLGIVEEGITSYNTSNTSINPHITASSGNFMYSSIGRAGFEFSEGMEEAVSTIFSSGLWIYGISEADTIVSVTTYDPNTNWIAGPVSNEFNYEYLKKYYQVYPINRSEIEHHQSHFMNPFYEIPKSILNWPAHGNVENGEPFFLAPFKDINGNGYYEPELGDYPDVPGDHCVFKMFNDKFNYSPRQDNETHLPDSLNIEIHQILYLFDSEDEAVNHTLYSRFKIINRSHRDYSKMRCTIWNDWDVGNHIDDYVGCDSLNNYFYGYNGDDIDQAINLSYGYGDFPAAAGCVFLNQSMTNCLYYNIGSNPINGDPVTDKHYYNYMNSLWKNGAQMLWGGNGVSGAYVTDAEANFMFPSYPWENQEPIWNEVSSGNLPSDRRSLASGEEFSLVAGEEICFEIAYVMARDTMAVIEPHLASLVKLKQYVAQINSLYQAEDHFCQKNYAAPTIDNGTTDDNWFQVYPNPGGDQIFLALPYDGKTYQLKIYGAIGQLVENLSFIANDPYQLLNTKTWTQGMYFVELIGPDKTLVRQWIKADGY